MTDAELDLAYRSRGSLPPEERAAVERAHAEMVARYNREWGTPDNVAANLDAAASPVTPDPAVRAKPRAAPAVTQQPNMGPPPTKWQELMEDPRNFSLEEADMIAAESDPGIQGILEGAPNRYERFGREMNELDARLGWERGHPAKEAPYPDLVPRSASPVVSERPQGRVPADPEDYRFDTRTGVVGPRTDDGRKPRLAPTFSSAEEAAEYYVRPRHPKTGELMPSRADEAMAARGFVATDTPTGDSAYQLGYASGEPAPPGVIDELNYYRQHRLPNGQLAYEMESKDGPTGTFDALVPTEALRKYQAERAQKISAGRVARLTGRSAADLIDPEARGEAYRAHYEDKKREQMDRLATRNWLAGGSQNINSGNRAMWNQLAMMSPEDQIRQLQYALPGGDLRASVDARQLDMAARLAQQAVTGALAGTAAGPLAAAQAEGLNLANDKQRAEQRAVVENDLAEQYAATGYFGYDEFTTEEQQAMIDTLVDVHGYTLPEAQAAVDRIAAQRRATERLPRPGAASPAGG